MALGVHSFKAEVCATYLQSLIDCYIPVCHPLHLLLTRQALTEVSVLSDLLQITQNHRQYLVLDPAAVPQPTGVSPVFQYLAKKKVFASRGCHSNILTWPLWCIQSQALSVAAGILRSGTKTLSKISSKSEREFHKTLLQLRERWKLRRTPTGIVGDLSFCQMEKSMSPWMGTGRWKEGSGGGCLLLLLVSALQFEVHKREGLGTDLGNILSITIPRELRGRSEVVVFISDKPVRGKRWWWQGLVALFHHQSQWIPLTPLPYPLLPPPPTLSFPLSLPSPSPSSPFPSPPPPSRSRLTECNSKASTVG